MTPKNSEIVVQNTLYLFSELLKKKSHNKHLHDIDSYIPHRYHRTGYIEIDGTEIVDGTSPGNLKQLNVGNRLYIGKKKATMKFSFQSIEKVQKYKASPYNCVLLFSTIRGLSKMCMVVTYVFHV